MSATRESWIREAADDLDGVEYDTQKHAFVAGDVHRKALTYVRLDGDTVVVIPEAGGQIDSALWATHAETVQRAQAQRTELIKSLLEAVSGLLGAAKSGR